MRESATTTSDDCVFERTLNATTREFVSTPKLSTRSCQRSVSSGSVFASGTPSVRQLAQPCVDQPPLERRHDDHVRGPERACDDADEDEDDAGPDPAR